MMPQAGSQSFTPNWLELLHEGNEIPTLGAIHTPWVVSPKREPKSILASYLEYYSPQYT